MDVIAVARIDPRNARYIVREPDFSGSGLGKEIDQYRRALFRVIGRPNTGWVSIRRNRANINRASKSVR